MTAVFIAGDWGSSQLRLYLRRGGQILDRTSGPGAMKAQGKHETTLFSAIEPWLTQYQAAPIRLCGMVGSRNGWVETPYVACPAGAGALRAQRTLFHARGVTVGIVPGLQGVSPRGAPDVMRGEETQIIGALALRSDLARGRHLLALPGTHTKWVLVEDGCIVTFQTAFTGELFALLRDHGSLTQVGGASAEAGNDGYAEGLRRYAETGAGGLTHALFETRSRQLIDGWDSGFAVNFLSGLLIASDVAGALTLFDIEGQTVTLIGEPIFAERYGQALARHGVQSQALSGEACALAGLDAIFQPSAESDAP